MPRQQFDMGSKWLLQNQGKSALFIGGFPRVERLEPMAGEALLS